MLDIIACTVLSAFIVALVWAASRLSRCSKIEGRIKRLLRLPSHTISGPDLCHARGLLWQEIQQYQTRGVINEKLKHKFDLLDLVDQRIQQMKTRTFQELREQSPPATPDNFDPISEFGDERGWIFPAR
jgi:hypothetical protein